jgi:hypothetical protein
MVAFPGGKFEVREPQLLRGTIPSGPDLSQGLVEARDEALLKLE